VPPSSVNVGLTRPHEIQNREERKEEEEDYQLPGADPDDPERYASPGPAACFNEPENSDHGK